MAGVGERQGEKNEAQQPRSGGGGTSFSRLLRFDLSTEQRLCHRRDRGQVAENTGGVGFSIPVGPAALKFRSETGVHPRAPGGQRLGATVPTAGVLARSPVRRAAGASAQEDQGVGYAREKSATLAAAHLRSRSPALRGERRPPRHPCSASLHVRLNTWGVPGGPPARARGRRSMPENVCKFVILRDRSGRPLPGPTRALGARFASQAY